MNLKQVYTPLIFRLLPIYSFLLIFFARYVGRFAANLVRGPLRYHNAVRCEHVADLRALLLYSPASLTAARRSECWMSGRFSNENALQALRQAISFWMNTFGRASLMKAGLQRLY